MLIVRFFKDRIERMNITETTLFTLQVKWNVSPKNGLTGLAEFVTSKFYICP